MEYEYSFFTGVLTLSRVLGGRSRRVLAAITLKEVSAAYLCNDENAPRIANLEASKQIYAASHGESPNLYAVLCECDGTKTLFYLELNEKALKILRYYNISAFSKANH